MVFPQIMGPTPTYQLLLEERDEYLYARVTADTIDQESALQYLTEIANRCDAIECEKLLIYRDIPVMLPDGVLFMVTAEFQKMIAGIRTAFVNPYEPNVEAFNFALTVGENRGAEYKLFNNEEDAIAWLVG